MTMLQVIIDAIHDENDWTGVAAGLRDVAEVEDKQATNVLATDELAAIRSALLSMAAYLASTDDRASVPMVLGGHLGDGDETGMFDHIIRWVMEGQS